MCVAHRGFLSFNPGHYHRGQWEDNVYKKISRIIKLTKKVSLTVYYHYTPGALKKISDKILLPQKLYSWSKFKQLLHLLLSEWTTPVAPPLEQPWPWCTLQGPKGKKIVICRWLESDPTGGSRGMQEKIWGNENRWGSTFWKWEGLGGIQPSIFNTLHPNTSFGCKVDSIFGKLHAIHFPSRNAIGELRVLD